MNPLEQISNFSKEYNFNLFVGGDYAICQYFNEPISNYEIIVPHHDLLEFVSSYIATEIFNSKIVSRENFYELDIEDYNIKFQSFSIKSFMHNDEILSFTNRIGIDNSSFSNNIYGREFTFQTILYDLKDMKFIDPVGTGLDDLKDKKIVTVLPPDLLIKYSPLSILNAIKFSVKYDFFIEKELKYLIKSNIKKLHNFMSRNRLKDSFVSMLDINEDLLLKTMEDYNINILPEEMQNRYEKTFTE